MKNSESERIIQVIRGTGILPAIVFKSQAWIEPLGKILKKTGFGAVEVLFRSAGASEAVREFKRKFPYLFVGAGTVLTCEQASEAFEAGADFIISPGYGDKLVDFCLQRNKLIIPGCSSASEIQRAYEAGLRVLKLFPAERLGGVGAVKDLAAPFSGVEFIPTGGINMDNLDGYMQNNRVLAVGGSFMAPYSLLESERYEAVADLYEKAARAAVGFRFAHVGVNCQSDAEAVDSARRLSALFGFPVTEKANSVYSGTGVEYLCRGGYGEKGHIGISTYSMERAITYLKARGAEFIEESRKYDAAGNLSCVYLKEEIAGFAVHIVK